MVDKRDGRPYGCRSLRVERSNVPRDSAFFYGAEEIGNNGAAFSETRLQHWIPEQVRSLDVRVTVHLKVIQAEHLK